MTFTTAAVWLASDPSGDTSGAMLVTLTGAGAGVNDGRSGPGPRTHRSMVYVRTPAADDCGCGVQRLQKTTMGCFGPNDPSQIGRTGHKSTQDELSGENW